jgi:hypothetical protein
MTSGNDATGADPESLSPGHRAAMAAFIANVTNYGSNGDPFRSVRASVCAHTPYDRLVDSIEAARQKHGLPSAGAMNPPERDKLAAFLQDDPRFIGTCITHIGFISHIIDVCFVVTAPDGSDIPEDTILEEPVVLAFAELGSVV